MSTAKTPIKTEPLVVEWHDPRLTTGEPAAAAEMAIRQLMEIARLLQVAASVGESMVRNAVMTEGLDWSIENDPGQWWEQSWQKAKLDTALHNLDTLQMWAQRTVQVWSDGR